MAFAKSKLALATISWSLPREREWEQEHGMRIMPSKLYIRINIIRASNVKMSELRWKEKAQRTWPAPYGEGVRSACYVVRKQPLDYTGWQMAEMGVLSLEENLMSLEAISSDSAHRNYDMERRVDALHSDLQKLSNEPRPAKELWLYL
uniref:Uncharacterized protein n=1 Tax=Oryza brachyantha TaxID=4533 RepID=J3KU70_ORYBR